MSEIGFLDPQLFNLMGSMSPDVQNVIVIMIMIYNTSSLPKLVVALRVSSSFFLSILHEHCSKLIKFEINSNSVANTHSTLLKFNCIMCRF